MELVESSGIGSDGQSGYSPRMLPSRIYLRKEFSSSIDTERLNIFIGSNGAGKTRVLQLIREFFDELEGGPTPLNIRQGALPESKSNSPHARSMVGQVDGIIPFISPGQDLTEAFFVLDQQDKSSLNGQEYFCDLLAEFGYASNNGNLPWSEGWGRDVATWILGLRDDQVTRKTGTQYAHSPTSLKPLRTLLSVARKSGDGLLLTFLSNVSVVAVRSRGAWSSLLARVRRDEIEALETSLGLPKGAIESNLNPFGLFQGVRPIEVANIDMNGSGRLASRAISLDESEGDAHFTSLYQWDDDLLVPLIDILNSRLLPGFPDGTFIPDSTRQIELDFESLVLEFAASIGFHITGRDFNPRVDWIYRFGKASKDRFFEAKDERNVNSVFRVHPAVISACRFIGQFVNQNLPDFISREYEFVITPLTPERWVGNRRVEHGLKLRSHQLAGASDENWVTARINENRRGELLDLWDAGAGIRRWVLIVASMLRDAALNLRFDFQQLEEAFHLDMQERGVDVDEEFDSLEMEWELWSYFCESETGHSLIEYRDVEPSQVLLIDEPEANLHPEGVSSVARWLVDQSVKFGSVFVATHSIKILDIDTPRISRYSIKSVGIEKFVTKIAVDPSHIDDWSHDLGVTPGELFLTTKRWLFVEGEVDKIVIETLFDDLLSQRGVRVVPARGSKNISHLMQLDFIRGVGGNVAVLLDKNAPDVRGQDEDQLRNSIEKGFFKRDLEETRKSINHKVGPSAVLLGVKEHHHIDMMFFFEPACVRDVLQDSPPRANQANSRIFDSWDEAWASFEKALVDASFAPSGSKPRKRTVHDFKAYLDVTFGIRVTPWFAKKVTHAMKVRGIVPEDLFALIDEVTSPLFGSPLS